MDEQQEIERLRDHWHDLRDAVGATATTVAVIQERQSAVKEQLDRIEAAVIPLPQKIAVLEARSADAASSAAKWGAGVGGAISALIAGAWQAVKG